MATRFRGQAAVEYQGPVQSGTTLPAHDAAAIITDGSSSNNGDVVPFTTDANRLFVGFNEETVIGGPRQDVSGDAISGDTAKRAAIDVITGYQYERTITGATDNTSIGDEVFLTGAGTLSTTPEEDAPSVGWVAKVEGSQPFFRAWDAGMLAQKVKGVATPDIPAFLPTATALIVQHRVPYAATLESVEYNVRLLEASPAWDTIALELRIRARGTSSGASGTTVTGGTLTLSNGVSLAEQIAAAAITDNNTLNEGDYLQLHATLSGTAPGLASTMISMQPTLRMRLGS